MTARASASFYSAAIPADRRSPTHGVGTALSGRRSPTLDRQPGWTWRWRSTRLPPAWSCSEARPDPTSLPTRGLGMARNGRRSLIRGQRLGAVMRLPTTMHASAWCSSAGVRRVIRSAILGNGTAPNGPKSRMSAHPRAVRTQWPLTRLLPESSCSVALVRTEPGLTIRGCGTERIGRRPPIPGPNPALVCDGCRHDNRAIRWC
jgi:hypothetical protein